MNNLISEMAKDAEAIPVNNLEKIGAVATDIADNKVWDIKTKKT